MGTVLSSGARVGEALAAATEALVAAGVDSPRLDAELLLGEATASGVAGLLAHPEAELSDSVQASFEEMLARRIEREPVAYILGSKGFRRLQLEVDQRVLIPRPESELLVELALERGPRSILDVGTGSGAIALAVADELPGCAVGATDTSAQALEVARANAGRLGLGERVAFELATLPRSGRFEVLLANLPYVREDEWAQLEPEITRYEPRSALLAGDDGLDAIRDLLIGLAEHPRVEVDSVALEVGAGQAPAVVALLGAAGFVGAEVRRDLAGVERCVLGRRI